VVVAKSHHTPYEGIFEKNDLFGLLFGVPAAVGLMIGLEYAPLHFLAWWGRALPRTGFFTYFSTT
jgi:hypothetical protein